MNDVSEKAEAAQRDAFAALSIDEKLNTLFQVQLALFRYVKALEEKADQMTSPDAMAKMMEGFMGGMMKF